MHDPTNLQPNTDLTRHAAPAGCQDFTPEQESQIDAAFLAWEASGYAVKEGEAYTSLRRKFQYANMLKAL